jgi:hypothetical protein
MLSVMVPRLPIEELYSSLINTSRFENLAQVSPCQLVLAQGGQDHLLWIILQR